MNLFSRHHPHPAALLSVKQQDAVRSDIKYYMHDSPYTSPVFALS